MTEINDSRLLCQKKGSMAQGRKGAKTGKQWRQASELNGIKVQRLRGTRAFDINKVIKEEYLSLLLSAKLLIINF